MKADSIMDNEPLQDTDIEESTATDSLSNEVTTIPSTSKQLDNDSITEYSFEDYYIDAFISTNNKAESYKKACVATDYTIPVYPTQSAYSYHKRLERDGIIDKAITAATRSDRIQSRLKLVDLLEADSESVQFQAAKHMTGDMYSNESTAQGIVVNVNRDNVEITHKNQTLSIKDKE